MDVVTFEQNLKGFKNDPVKAKEIRKRENEMETDVQEELEEKDKIKMTRQQILDYLKLQFDLQNKFIKERSTDKVPLTAQQHSLEISKMSDKLFLKTNFEDFTF